MVYDAIVVGGGAAGLAAAGFMGEKNMRVLIIEKNSRCARKVMITGKGRCNVTNEADTDTLIGSVPANGRFLYSAFTGFSPYDTMALFERLGVRLKVERGNRVFPESDKAVDIVDALVKFALLNGKNHIETDCSVSKLIIEDGRVTGVETSDGRKFFANRVVVATGGMSYPRTGSTGDGYRLAMQAGHTIVEPKPSLVPLVAKNGFCSKLQGLSLRNVAISYMI